MPANPQRRPPPPVRYETPKPRLRRAATIWLIAAAMLAGVAFLARWLGGLGQ
ncbi:hypothetical protein [Bordetella genomosp. 1]|uniref:hypothetical protein n=1 Tax=Bordetella genomosp. 1 TaxID=1395607 RepID=UPI0015C5B14D|nr:hypothetical protein [Bordetella genomosp. 1]